VQSFQDVGIDTRGRPGSFKMQCPRCGGKTDLSVDTEKLLHNKNGDVMGKGAYKCHKAKCDFQGYLKDDPRPVQWQKKDYFKPEFENNGLNDKAEEFFKHRCIPLEIVCFTKYRDPVVAHISPP